MKSSLWVVVVVVTGIVGFLVGYAMSSSTGSKNALGGKGADHSSHAVAPSYATGAAEPAPAKPVSTGGYK